MTAAKERVACLAQGVWSLPHRLLHDGSYPAIPVERGETVSAAPIEGITKVLLEAIYLAPRSSYRQCDSVEFQILIYLPTYLPIQSLVFLSSNPKCRR